MHVTASARQRPSEPGLRSSQQARSIRATRAAAPTPADARPTPRHPVQGQALDAAGEPSVALAAGKVHRLSRVYALTSHPLALEDDINGNSARSSLHLPGDEADPSTMITGTPHQPSAALEPAPSATAAASPRHTSLPLSAASAAHTRTAGAAGASAERQRVTLLAGAPAAARRRARPSLRQRPRASATSSDLAADSNSNSNLNPSGASDLAGAGDAGAGSGGGARGPSRAAHALLADSRSLVLLALLLPLVVPLARLYGAAGGVSTQPLLGWGLPSLLPQQQQRQQQLQQQQQQRAGGGQASGWGPRQGREGNKRRQGRGGASLGWADAATKAARNVRAAAVSPAAPPGSPAQGGPSPGGWNADAAVRVVAVVPQQLASPYRTTWGELALHTAQRLAWSDPSFQMRVFFEEDLVPERAGGGSQGDRPGGEAAHGGARQELVDALKEGCQILVGMGLQQPSAAAWLTSQGGSAASLPATTLFLESASGLTSLNRLAGLRTPPTPSSPASAPVSVQPGGPLEALTRLAQQLRSAVGSVLSGGTTTKAAQLYKTVQELYGRRNSDDFLFIFLVLINEYVRPVPEVSMTTKGFDLDSLRCMITNCGRQVVDCVNDPVCKAGLDCLQACSFNDQVCQYRCIVSHETPKFEQFSLCILQLHNCRNLDAKMPTRPDPQPMSSFRGQPLTHEMAEDMFIGWMAPEAASAGGAGADAAPLPYSWLVAAGKNPAYDYFPSQHQLFYRGRGKAFWYEPVFRVITLSGEKVWRRRRYRVRRGQLPGTFYFSVLDNGVTSNEFWRVLDCDEGYEWCLFYYSGAASAAGLSYSGAVLASRDGNMPTRPEALRRLERALDAGGIKMWELSLVDNTDREGAPLQLSATT